MVESWSAEVERFLAYKAAQDPVGPVWKWRMNYELRRVPKLLRGIGVPVPASVHDVGSEHLLAMREKLRWEKATFSLHFAALKQFLRWAENPVLEQKALWRTPSGETSHRRWLSKERLRVLCEASEGRERLLIALEGFNGLRRVEVLRLRAKDVLLDEESLRVHGKGRNGGKWRKIPLHPMVRPLVAGAVKGKQPEERLMPLSMSGADLLLRRAAERAGFPAQGVPVSHHDLRRTFGRLAHEAGMDLVQLKNLFGHASIEMTVHYIGLDADRMREGLEKLHLAYTRPTAESGGDVELEVIPEERPHQSPWTERSDIVSVRRPQKRGRRLSPTGKTAVS